MLIDGRVPHLFAFICASLDVRSLRKERRAERLQRRHTLQVEGRYQATKAPSSLNTEEIELNTLPRD